MSTQEIAKELTLKAMEHLGLSLLALKPDQSKVVGKIVGEMYVAALQEVEQVKKCCGVRRDQPLKIATIGSKWTGLP